MVAIQNVNEALERVIKRDVKYRFVIEFEKSLRSSDANRRNWIQ